MSIGPKTTVRRSCDGCEVCQTDSYVCQSDSGRDVYCAHPSLMKRRIIGDTQWDTPTWCPAQPEIAARADAELAALRAYAERYRWLRAGHTDGPYVVDWHGCMIVGEDADEDVDAARGEAK